MLGVVIGLRTMGPECPRIGWAAGLQFQLEGVAQSPVGTAQENNAPWDGAPSATTSARPRSKRAA
jgi:hypothetical protein